MSKELDSVAHVRHNVPCDSPQHSSTGVPGVAVGGGAGHEGMEIGLAGGGWGGLQEADAAC